MFAYSAIRRVHMELTTRCNAACPMCSRNERGGQKISDLPEVELTLADVRQILPPDLIAQLTQVWLCGNYGDPILAREMLETVVYLKANNPRIRIGMNTNGSARRPEWWRQLAPYVDDCHFGIDGLADTNHLYRRRTHWDTIMANATAFIEAGGAAHWEYIVFQHNEHQIEEARALAGCMGFRKFRLRKTGRFFFSGILQPALSVKDRHGNEAYKIEPPKSSNFSNTASLALGGLAQLDKYKNYMDETCITCKSQKQQEIYISAEGLVFPCCYLASFYRGAGRKQDSQFMKMIERLGGRDIINGRVRGVSAIISDDLFQKVIPGSWSHQSVADGRLATCSSACGALSPTKGQYTT